MDITPEVCEEQIQQKIKIAYDLINRDRAALVVAVNDLKEFAYQYNNKFGIAYSLWFEGVLNAYENDIDAALQKFESALKESSKYQFKEIMSSSYFNMGNMLTHKGELALAIDAINKGIELADQLNNEIAKASGLSSLANIYAKYMNDIDLALELYIKAEDCYKNNNATSRLAFLYINICNCYMFKEQYETVLFFANKIIEYNIDRQNHYELAGAYQVLTSLYIKQNDFVKAKENLAKFKNEMTLSGIGFNNYGIAKLEAELLFHAKEYNASMDVIVKSKEQFDEKIDLGISLEMNTFLSKIYAINADYKNAYETLCKVNQIKEEIFKQDTNNIIQKQKILHQTEKLEQEYKIKLLKSEMDILRAQMNPHFIFNSLSSINKFILKNETDDASNYLVKFSQLIRTVLDNARSELVSLSDELKTLKLYIEIESLRFGKKVTTFFDLQDDYLQHDIEIPPLILQPFVENAIWHGLMNKDTTGTLSIKGYKQSATIYIVEIEDDGIGRKLSSELNSKNKQKHNSHGMQVTNGRLQLYNMNNTNKIHWQVIDKEEDGIPIGTKVVFTFELAN